MRKKNKVVKYRKPFNFNIGIVIFVIIFIYLVFNVYSYMTTTHISVYEVEQGTMAVNNIYRGLILREEEVYYANYTGALNFYVREGSKVGYQNLVYSIDENGSISEMINSANQDISALDEEELSKIEENIYEFQNSYDSQTFYNVYSFQENMNSALNEVLSLHAINELGDYASNAHATNTFHPITANRPGIVVYYTDGYENVRTDNFSSDMFDEAAYTKISNQTAQTINAGDAVYKLITSENWSIVLPVTADTAQELAEDDILQLRFVKDDKKMYASYTLKNIAGQDYVILNLRSAMIRYAKERYIEVELLLKEETGLKIPNSAITEKQFFTIPKEYFMRGGDSKNEGILVQRRGDDNTSYTEFVAPTIYYETEEYYYIDNERVSAQDSILKPDSSSSYVIGSNTAVLKGVYNINKGYAVFKQIDILYQNEEYSIVQTGTTYGIALYDHIALDGSKIKENDLVTQ